jgi:hypothetical protein
MTEQPQTLVAALVAFQRAMPTIGRNCTGTTGGHKYRYADFAQVVGAIRIPLADAGLAFVQLLDGDVLVTKLLFTGGDELASRMPLHLADLTPQQVGSALTYSRRYALTALLGVAIGGEDDDAADAESAHASPSGRSSSDVLKEQLKASLTAELAKQAKQAKGDTPARPEHVRDSRFQRLTGEDGRPLDLFKRINGAVYWARVACKTAVSPLFDDLDAAADASALEAVPLSTENAIRLEVCRLAVPAWYSEFQRRFEARKADLNGSSKGRQR